LMNAHGKGSARMPGDRKAASGVGSVVADRVPYSSHDRVDG
jgi:hypothetical protein